MKISIFLVLLGLITGASAIPIQAASPAEALAKESAPPQFYEMEVWVTAYSSTPEETDDTPFITASGKEVAYGIVAINLFDFGTKIKIPEIFGDRIFIVEDRMHSRKKDFVDVWMPTKEEAQNFGIARTKIQILLD